MPATWGQQGANKRTTRLYKIGDKTMSLRQWAIYYKKPYATVAHRIKKLRMSVVEALTKPPSKPPRRVQYKGEWMIPKELSRRSGVPLATLLTRLPDLELAVDGCVWGGFGTTGQRCTAASRVVVHEKVYRPFLDQFVARARSLVALMTPVRMPRRAAVTAVMIAPPPATRVKRLVFSSSPARGSRGRS